MDKENITYCYYNGIYTSLTGILESYDKYAKEFKKDKEEGNILPDIDVKDFL